MMTRSRCKGLPMSPSTSSSLTTDTLVTSSSGTNPQAVEKQNIKMKYLTNRINSLEQRVVLLHEHILKTKPSESHKLDSQNELSMNQRTVSKNASVNEETNQPTTTSTKSKWLQDEYISAYMKSLTTEVLNVRKDILILNPSLTQVLKTGSLYDVTSTMTNLHFDEMNFAIFCLSDHSEY